MSYLFKNNKNFYLIIKYLFIIIFIIIFYFGLISYSGDKIIYFLFSFLNILLFYFIFRKKALFFEVFFGLLLFLGFWFKLSVTLSITPFTVGQFSEGSGLFDHEPKSYDEVIIISSIGIIAFIFTGLLRQIFFWYPKKIFFERNKNFFYKKNRTKLWILFLIFSLLVFILNINYGIYQKGLVSNFQGNSFFSNILKWLLIFGLTSISSWLLSNEIRLNKINYMTYFISIFEIFLSSLSMISRGMIFNSAAIYYGIYKFSKKLNLFFKIKKFLIFLFFIFVLFYISVVSVNHIRKNFFYIGKSIPSENNLIIKDNSLKKNKIIKSVTEIDIPKQNSEFVYLVINRWVGIDAIMAITAKKEILSFNLFRLAFYERFDRYGISFYEKNFNLKDNIVQKIDTNAKGNTLIGIIGFSYYTGSKLFIFLFVSFLCLSASIIEFLSFKISNKNIIFSSLIGQIIAFRFIHFGYLPHQTYLLFSAIFLSILMIYILNKIQDLLNKKYK